MQEHNDILQNYSLDADILTGWKPKMKIIGPMPLNFDNSSLDSQIKPLIYSDTSIHEVIYLGFRPRDTFQMHSYLAKNYKYKYRHLLNTDYSHLKPFFKKFYSQFQPQYKMPFNGMNPKTKSNVIFQSRFESGNLDYVIKTKANQFDLFLRIDSNTNGHIMWYYFKVINKLQKSRTIRLNICNLRKSKTFYDNCMKPYVYRKNIGWKQEQNNLIISEEKVSFYKQHLIFSNGDQIEEPPTYRKLSFDLNLNEFEEVQIAYSIPYTYSQMLQDIRDLKAEAKKIQNLQFNIDTTNISLSGLEIPYIKIFNNNQANQGMKKQTVLVIGRQHPGQSNGSHVLKGFMQQLVKSKQRYMSDLREHFVFHIIPMVNPDGVLIGNFRTSLYGKDLNRLFLKNQTLMIPEVQFCKNLMFQLTKKKKKKIFMFLDFHGHSVKKNAFCFAPGTFQTNSIQDIRQFPRLISDTTDMFRFPSCSFRISNHKKSTARAVFCPDTNLCYTIQTSNWSYYSKKQRSVTLFNSQLWQQLGKYLMKSLGLFYQKILERKVLKKRRMEGKSESSRLLEHNSSGLIRNKAKKFHLKTQQNQNQLQKSINFVIKQQSSSIFTQKVMPISMRSVNASDKKLKNDVQFIPSERRQKQQQLQFQIQKDISEKASEEDSDQSETQDMDKQKFKKYIKVATRMLIQFQKAYYGQQYTAKARYQMPKKTVIKKKQIAIPILQQACLKSKSKQQKKTLQSQKYLLKIGYSEQKAQIKFKQKKMQELSKKGNVVNLNDIITPSKQQALSALPRISIVNYMAYEQIDEKPRIFRIPKIQSVHIKNIKKY